MFDLIKTIEVDRKNSLPVADLHARYKRTGTPVIFGDLIRRWPATKKWNFEYIKQQAANVEVAIFSNKKHLNLGYPKKPVLTSKLGELLEGLKTDENDFRVSKASIFSMPNLIPDFTKPRLGFDFNKGKTNLYIGAQNAVEPMVQSSKIVHRVYCHLGAPVAVLLIPPVFSGFMYRVGNSRDTVRDIDFNDPDFEKYPALKYLQGYVAELNHGDSLYIPAGFWYCIAYQGPSIMLRFEAITGKTSDYIRATIRSLVYKLGSIFPERAERLDLLENKTVKETNQRLEKNNLR